ncbi:hypothetical protein [Bacillus solitudinis]
MEEIDKNGKFRLQQNLISHHYRILDEESHRCRIGSPLLLY